MGPRRISLLTATLIVVAFLLAPAAAQATFHLIQVREVYAGSAAAPESKFVELQMYAGGQNHVGGHALRIYDAAGAVTSTSIFVTDVAGAANQSTILVATPEADAEFGVSADLPLASPTGLGSTGGAACWEEIDCVSWGDFGGTLPSPAGAPVSPAGIADGMAIRRSITRGCATLLDPADDSGDSAADFTVVSPEPRPNSVAPSEQRCATSGPNGGAGSSPSKADAPKTILRRMPPKRTVDRTPSFRFVADIRGARFECKLDRKPYRSCRSPYTAKRLAYGPHQFSVRAVADGLQDATPASYRFTLVRRLK